MTRRILTAIGSAASIAALAVALLAGGHTKPNEHYEADGPTPACSMCHG
jgi:hypothetical protein